MKRISSQIVSPILAICLVLALAAPAAAYEAFKGFLGVLQNEPGATEGYILVCPQNSTITYLMDKDGNVINEWHSQYRGFYAELLPNGNMARHSRSYDGLWMMFGGESGLIEEFDWDGNLVWSHATFDLRPEPGGEISHHTFEVMPNGNYLILVWQYHSYDDAVAKGLDLNDSGRRLYPEGIAGMSGIQVYGIWPDVIREVDHEHNIVWEFKIWDHTGAVDDYHAWNINKYLPAAENPGEAGPDWTHANGVAYNPRTNQVTFTSRAMGEVYVIDYTTQELVYRWGNPYNWGGGNMSHGYGDNGDQILFGPHAPDWTVDDTITILDNGSDRPSGAATGFYEIDPVADAVVFDWHSNNVGVQLGTYYSMRQCGVNKMPNGHYLLSLSTGGSIIEIAPDKSIVWEFVNPMNKDTHFVTSSGHGQTGNDIHRAMFYAPDWPGFAGKDMTRILYSWPNWVDKLSIDPAPKTPPIM